MRRSKPFSAERSLIKASNSLVVGSLTSSVLVLSPLPFLDSLFESVGGTSVRVDLNSTFTLSVTFLVTGLYLQ